MKLQRLLIVLLILLSLIPIAYMNQWLQRVIQPRRSFIQLMLYVLASLVLVFVYTFLLVWIITYLFPKAKG
jgi:hypothetical protein